MYTRRPLSLDPLAYAIADYLARKGMSGHRGMPVPLSAQTTSKAESDYTQARRIETTHCRERPRRSKHLARFSFSTSCRRMAPRFPALCVCAPAMGAGLIAHGRVRARPWRSLSSTVRPKKKIRKRRTKGERTATVPFNAFRAPPEPPARRGEERGRAPPFFSMHA